MKCPFCGFAESKVIDSRPTDDNTSIRRRRECLDCQKRFTTYEKLETIPIIVVKKDKTREVFSRDKIINGLIRACEKRPVSMEQMEKIASEVERNVQQNIGREVPSSAIGEEISRQLKDIDEVAYVRFASVYRQFKDVNSFMEELKSLLEDKSK